MFTDMGVLSLLDGAYFDNSGGWVAVELLDSLERYLRPRRVVKIEAFNEYAEDIRFHLVQFTDRPAQRFGGAAQEQYSELLAPLIAFDTARSARGAQLRDILELDRTGATYIFLSDPWFTPSLNWLLSQDTKAKIEVRSKGELKPADEVCCVMVASFPDGRQAKIPEGSCSLPIGKKPSS